MSLFDVEKLLGNWKEYAGRSDTDTSPSGVPRKISCRQLDSGHLVIRMTLTFVDH